MNLFSSSKREKYFFTKESFINTNNSVELVLSPEFYWIRVFEIPVDSAHKAIKLLPTLFEEIVPQQASYHYHAIHLEENNYLCFAYNSDEVLEFIKKSGLNINQVHQVYFAQTQMIDYDKFIINESGYIYEKDILIKVPKAFCEDAHQLDELIENEIATDAINLQRYSSIISTLNIKILSVLLLVVTFLSLTKYFYYDHGIQENQNRIEALKSLHKLPQTSFQMNAIINSMNQDKSTHRRFQDSLLFILSYKYAIKEGKIIKISYKDGKFILWFKQMNQNLIKRYLQKRLRVLNSTQNKDIVKIEVAT